MNTQKYFDNEFGAFVEDGREYEIILDARNRPPAPWINVIAQENFGFLVSETGAGFSWLGNSRENKLSPWNNDPVSDPASEAIYIHDEISGKMSTPTSLGRKGAGSYRVRHGFGYSTFFHTEDSIDQELTVFCPKDDPVKVSLLTLSNSGEQERYLKLTYYIEWVLGVDRNLTNPYIISEYNNEHEYLSAKTVYAYEYRKHNAFIFSSEMIKGYSGDKQEIFGSGGTIRNPKGLSKKLSNTTGACYDSCGAIQITIALKPHEKKEIAFALGYCEDETEIKMLCHAYKNVENTKKALSEVKDFWKHTLTSVQIKTNDLAMDTLMNGWFLYQTISCRLWARAAFYQCGGAYGYRDQLQDTLALVYHDPHILRNQILLAASRQFEEGDVQHWWHPPTGLGVRTRITDDLLWLPYALAYYISCTGDYSVLYESVPYLKAEPLKENEHDAMVQPEITDYSESIYLHAKKSIERTRFGEHGLPLMGGGDWNDGMNTVGIEGKGESCWLGWFLYTVLDSFAPLATYMGEAEYAQNLELKQNALRDFLECETWDGEWYLRAFYDDGTKIGSKESDECRIDSISQSWSIISSAADTERALQAFNSAWRYLVIEREGVSLLLHPPFDKTEKSPGYIKEYYPGVRENGGQYSHAAAWLAIAATLIGESERAHTLFSMLNPINSSSNRRDALKYEKEPYVMSADISYMAPYTGRGGWSWYTGSSAWAYQGILKYFLGLNLHADSLTLTPRVPQSFGEYSIRYRYKTSLYIIRVPAYSLAQKKSENILREGERAIEEGRIPLTDDGKEHQYCYIWD